MEAIRTLASREIHRNPWFRVRADDVEKGGWKGVHYVVELKPGASVLAIDAEDRVCLIREFKYAVYGVSLEVVSGGIEKNESPAEAARRELQEEAGLQARQWIEAGVVNPFTSVVQSPNHLFLARGLEAVERSPDAGEHLDVVWAPLDEAVGMVYAGQITHSASCILLLKAQQILAAGSRPRL